MDRARVPLSLLLPCALALVPLGACTVNSGDDDMFGSGAATDGDGDGSSSGTTSAGTDAGDDGGASGSTGDGDPPGGGSGATPQTCGNGVAEGKEQCDQNDFGFRNCQTYGYMAGNLSCNDDCTVDDSTCSASSICGDGEVTGLEECEPDDLQGATCDSLGLGTGELTCGPNCTFVATSCSCKGLKEPCHYNAADPSDPGGCCPAGYKGNEKGTCLTIPFSYCL